jgi:uncharacterized membrane protein
MLHCEELKRRIIGKALITGAVTAPFTTVLPGSPGNLAGFTLGVFFCIVNFSLLARMLERASAMEPARAALYAFSGYFLRYLLTGTVICISLLLPGINALLTIFGLFLIKLIILANNIGYGTEHRD